MISTDQAREVIGVTVTTSTGEKIGTAGQVFLDDQTNQPEWTTVSTGTFGGKESFIPLAEAQLTGDTMTVPYDKDTVKNAPTVDVEEGHLSQTEEAELYRYYGLDYSENRSDSGLPQGSAGNGERGVGHDTSGPNTDKAMTRSEEQVHAGTEKVTTGTARLRKWVETEEVQVTVPVTKEKAKLVTEPVTDANRGDAMAGGDLTEEEHEVTLTEERPIVTKETVPVERVRLEKDVETTQESVTTDVRKERISADGVNDSQR